MYVRGKVVLMSEKRAAPYDEFMLVLTEPLGERQFEMWKTLFLSMSFFW